MATVELNKKELNVDDKLFDAKKKSSKKRGGPYSKEEKIKRQNEVYRLHFDYGYSGRKIAELMIINRNTVNGDIDYWYSKIVKNTNILNPEDSIIITLKRFEIQRSRLREELDKTDSIQEKLMIERFIFNLDSKILNTYHRLVESVRKVADVSTQKLNDWMKENKKGERHLTYFDIFSVSKKAKEKIDKIIDEDRKKSNSFNV